MDVLIVESNSKLGRVWSRHIERLGATVSFARTQGDAMTALQDGHFDVVILDLELTLGRAFAVSDYISYRHPACKVIFVTSNSFFSDGSIFSYMSNACALIPAATRPEDMAALVEHHAR
jgi:DNA-binding NtrC family response regulator